MNQLTRDDLMGVPLRGVSIHWTGLLDCSHKICLDIFFPQTPFLTTKSDYIPHMGLGLSMSCHIKVYLLKCTY